MNKELKSILESDETSPADLTKVIAFCKELRMTKRSDAKTARDELKAQLEALKERRKPRKGESESEEETEEPRRKKGKKGKNKKRNRE